MAENFSSNYSRYYDLLYKDKNYKAESEYVSRLIRSFHPDAQDILELGCGTGNHAALFCQDGFKVTGIERSAEMVTQAKAKCIKGFTPIVGDIENYRLDEKSDVAISLFHVISYLTSNESLIECFKSTRLHLNGGGIFIFDVWYSPAVYCQQPETRIKRMEDEAIEVIRLAEPESHWNMNVVDVNYEIIVRDKKTLSTEIYNEKHPMRHFSLPEMQLLARLGGFEVLNAEEFMTGKEPSEKTWGVCFTLKKIDA